MTCLSPRTILLQRTTRSNLKFQCKIHERTRGPEAGGVGIFSRFYNEAHCRSWTVKKWRTGTFHFYACSPLLDYISMSDNNILFIIIINIIILYYIFAWVAVPETMYRENIPTPLLPVHAFFRVFYTETLNCSELFAAIKLFGVINKSFNFV